MTTIAFRSGVMAADRAAINGDLVSYLGLPKIARDANGVLYGACGELGPCSAVMEAVRRQAKTEGAVHLPIPKPGDEFEILIAYPDGRIRRLVPAGEEILDGADYVAIGSGQDFAYGALFARSSAIVAVEAACYHSKGSAGGVDCISFYDLDERSAGLGRSVVERDWLEDAYERGIVQPSADFVNQVYREMVETGSATTKLDLTEEGNLRRSLISKNDFYADGVHTTGVTPDTIIVDEIEDPETAFERIARQKDD